ncbi:MAG: Hsp20/alpha crystallin family protein [Anaerolineales bacterium]|nr:MAG: Hsp20/alpha crystallin family protein [Anaerolineales bacterium]
MTVSGWNTPLEPVTLRDAVDRLLADSFVRTEGHGTGSASERPLRLPVDAYSTPEEIVIVASLAGLTAEEVEIRIEGDTLTMRGELRAPLENVDYLFNERSYGAFSRTLTFNVPVQVDKAEAVFENGLLTLTLPKEEETKPKVVKVKAK